MVQVLALLVLAVVISRGSGSGLPTCGTARDCGGGSSCFDAANSTAAAVVAMMMGAAGTTLQ